MRRILILVLTAGLLGPAMGRAEEAKPGGISVSPVRIKLTADQRSALMSVVNQGERRRRLQITTNTWTQTPNGKMKLEPTDDVIAFPSLLVLEPGQKRNVRVGVQVEPAARERTYRLILDELPPPEDERGRFSGVFVLTRMSIPVFLRPLEPRPQPELSSVSLSRGKLFMTVRNPGNMHVLPEVLRVKGTDASGGVVIQDSTPGWYVLAGGKRQYEFRLDPDECARLASVQVEVGVTDKVLKRQIAVSKAGCKP